MIGLPNYYFDTKDYETPIKFRFDSNYYWGLLPGYTIQKTIKLSHNIAVDKIDYWPFETEKTYSYYSVGRMFENVSVIDSGNTVLAINLEIDDKYVRTERSVFTFTDLVSSIGGLLEIYLLVGVLISFVFNDKIYYSKLLSQLYHVRTKDLSGPTKVVPKQISKVAVSASNFDNVPAQADNSFNDFEKSEITLHKNNTQENLDGSLGARLFHNLK